MARKELMVSGSPARFRGMLAKSRYVVMPAVLTAACAFPALAAEGDASFDVTATLVSSFQTMATTMLGTIAATLPVVMSIMSAYLCINFGIRFFKRFAK